MSDHKPCDRCGKWTLWEGTLLDQYEFSRDRQPSDDPPYRVAGEEQTGDSGDRFCIDGVGDWAMLCPACAKTHRTMIVPIDYPEPPK